MHFSVNSCLEQRSTCAGQNGQNNLNLTEIGSGLQRHQVGYINSHVTLADRTIVFGLGLGGYRLTGFVAPCGNLEPKFMFMELYGAPLHFPKMNVVGDSASTFCRFWPLPPTQ
jgi:hypothetical protein